jgi:hypothetical protein
MTDLMPNARAKAGRVLNQVVKTLDLAGCHYFKRLSLIYEKDLPHAMGAGVQATQSQVRSLPEFGTS